MSAIVQGQSSSGPGVVAEVWNGATGAWLPLASTTMPGVVSLSGVLSATTPRSLDGIVLGDHLAVRLRPLGPAPVGTTGLTVQALSLRLAYDR